MINARRLKNNNFFHSLTIKLWLLALISVRATVDLYNFLLFL